MLELVKVVGCSFVAVGILLGRALGDAPNERLDLSPRVQPNSLTRVTVELDAGGSDLVRAFTTATAAEKSEQKLPMSVTARFQYDERRLVEPPADPGDAPQLLAIRHYDRAEGTLRIDTSGLAPKLSDDRRLILVESGSARPLLYSPNGTLPREELDLIESTAMSYLVDRLLPQNLVAKGDTWNHDAAVIGALLTLDSVAVCEVQSVLDEFNASFAKIRLAGVVHGTADGAATEREVRGVYLYDRRLRRIARLNLALREMRSIGAATPGLHGVAKLQVVIDSIPTSPQLTDEVVAAATRAAKAPQRNLIYNSLPLGFRVEHDRKWFITGEGRETMTLRRVDRNDVVSQCTITKLPAKSLGRQVPLDQFQKDVAYSLGKSFGQFISSREWTNSFGHHCFQVVVRGTVEELPVEWHYYLVAPESGHRISLAFMIEAPMVDRLQHADRQFVEAIELISPPAPSVQTAAQPAATPPK